MIAIIQKRSTTAQLSTLARNSILRLEDIANYFLEIQLIHLQKQPSLPQKCYLNPSPTPSQQRSCYEPRVSSPILPLPVPPLKHKPDFQQPRPRALQARLLSSKEVSANPPSLPRPKANKEKEATGIPRVPIDFDSSDFDLDETDEIVRRQASSSRGLATPTTIAGASSSLLTTSSSSSSTIVFPSGNAR